MLISFTAINKNEKMLHLQFNMYKILDFMNRRKGPILIILLAIGALFFAFKTNNFTHNQSLTKEQQLLTMIGVLLEKQHYSPKPLDDNFSKAAFKNFFDEIDEEKMVFLEEDIQKLKIFEDYIDDELRGSEIKFIPAFNLIYNKRIDEVIATYKKILEQPFDFTVDEEYSDALFKQSYVNTTAAREERWRKKLKALTLERYADMLEAREKLNKTDTAYKTNEALEKEARRLVLAAMDKTYNRIKNTFTEEKRFSTYVNVIANLMDPHTDYFPPVEKRAFDEQMSGRFYGIGAQLTEQDGFIKVASVVAGYPAWRSGEIEQNDIILKVAQGAEPAVDIAGYDVQDAVKLIRGNKNTEVRLTIKKPNGAVKVVSLIREEVVQDESYVRSAIIDEGNKKIGYIYLPDFYADFDRQDGNRCSEDVAKELIKLKAENVNGIIIDLRNNGGGSLYEVVQMVGLFIKQGPVVQVKDKEGKINVLSDNNPSVLYDGPLAVMVNAFSASASEIFAAAIQDYKRGIIIGNNTSTYGKGTVQRNIPVGKVLDYNTGRTEFGAMKLTFQKFYRINGGSTQLKGVEPDVVLYDNIEFLKFREKDQKNALPWDEIPKATYVVEKDEAVINAEIAKAKAAAQSNSALEVIKQNALWLAKNNEAPTNLQLNKYQEHQKLVKSTVAQNGKLAKLDKPMNIDVSTLDRAKFYNNPDKAKGERYQFWLRNLKTDVYLSTAKDIVLGIMDEMVARK